MPASAESIPTLVYLAQEKPLIISGVLLAEGLWNGKWYKAEEIQKLAERGLEKTLYLDVEHLRDPRFKDKDKVGKITELTWNDVLKAAIFKASVDDPEIVGLVRNGYFDAVSPMIWVENNFVNGKIEVSDLRLVKLSLTRMPACQSCVITHKSEELSKLANLKPVKLRLSIEELCGDCGDELSSTLSFLTRTVEKLKESLETLPFGPYKDFDDCTSKVMSKKGWGKDRASAYCAVVKRKIEGMTALLGLLMNEISELSTWSALQPETLQSETAKDEGHYFFVHFWDDSLPVSPNGECPEGYIKRGEICVKTEKLSMELDKLAWEETDDFIRSGHRDEGSFDKESFRTIAISEKEGIKAVIGCPSGKFSGGKCTVGTEVQSFLFSKEKGWTVEKAKTWFSEHKGSKEKMAHEHSEYQGPKLYIPLPEGRTLVLPVSWNITSQFYGAMGPVSKEAYVPPVPELLSKIDAFIAEQKALDSELERLSQDNKDPKTTTPPAGQPATTPPTTPPVTTPPATPPAQTTPPTTTPATFDKDAFLKEVEAKIAEAIKPVTDAIAKVQTPPGATATDVAGEVKKVLDAAKTTIVEDVKKAIPQPIRPRTFEDIKAAITEYNKEAKAAGRPEVNPVDFVVGSLERRMSESGRK